MRTVRRYLNRKLYDTKTSRYTSLPKIAELVRNGEEIRVLHRRSGRDLTSITLWQIILNETKHGRATPIPALRQIIVSGLHLD